MKQDNSRKKLNPAQSEAVAHNDGPCLVLAGPGSGKTLTVVKRVKRLLEEKKAGPDEILVITFTKYAAREMKERFWAEMDGKKLLQFIIIPTEMIGNTLSFQIIKIRIFSLANRLLCLLY